jgi:hypothetical protein
MDRTPGVHIVEVQRMTHTGVQQRRLWRRQTGVPQQHTAFLTPAPPDDHRRELIDPRRAAATDGRRPWGRGRGRWLESTGFTGLQWLDGDAVRRAITVGGSSLGCAPTST